MKNVKDYYINLTILGKKLRNRLIFGIIEDIDYSDFFKTKFLKDFFFNKRIEKIIK